MSQFLQKHHQQLKQFAIENDIAYLGLFGSYALGRETDNSDIDLLVAFKQPGGLLRRASVKLKLEELLHKKVDLVSRKSLSPELKPFIENEVVPIYETA